MTLWSELQLDQHLGMPSLECNGTMKENHNTTPLYCPRIPDLVSQFNIVSVRSLVTHECCGLSTICLKSWIVSSVVILINDKCWFNHGVRPFWYRHILSPIKLIFSITFPNEVPLFPTSLTICVIIIENINWVLSWSHVSCFIWRWRWGVIEGSSAALIFVCLGQGDQYFTLPHQSDLSLIGLIGLWLHSEQSELSLSSVRSESELSPIRVRAQSDQSPSSVRAQSEYKIINTRAGFEPMTSWFKVTWQTAINY